MRWGKALHLHLSWGSFEVRAPKACCASRTRCTWGFMRRKPGRLLPRRTSYTLLQTKITRNFKFYKFSNNRNNTNRRQNQKKKQGSTFSHKILSHWSIYLSNKRNSNLAIHLNNQHAKSHWQFVYRKNTRNTERLSLAYSSISRCTSRMKMNPKDLKRNRNPICHMQWGTPFLTRKTSKCNFKFKILGLANWNLWNTF